MIAEPGKLHWQLRDGDLYTHFRQDANGQWLLLDAAGYKTAAPGDVETSLNLSASASTQATRPAGSDLNSTQVSSGDKGPEIDPTQFAASQYNAVPIFRTFRSFASSAYATADTRIYASGDDSSLYDTGLVYPYPKFYKPTWGEVFDHVARQMSCAWSWNPENRQFKFERAKPKSLFSIDLADGWQAEDRGFYVWHAPKGKEFGMDIYYFGHYTLPRSEPAVVRQIREHVAMQLVGSWPNRPKLEDMTAAQVGHYDALQLKADTPRPGGVWRQWSVFADSKAFLIVSAMPKSSEVELMPAIEHMVGSFKVNSTSTKPAE